MNTEYNQNWDDDQKKKGVTQERYDRFWTGLVLIIIGAFLLLRKMGVDLPDWMFTWPMILVLVGIITGIKHRFQNMSWLIITGIGAFFLMDDVFETFNLRPYFFPVLIIGIGLVFILRPRKTWYFDKEKFKGFSPENKWQQTGFQKSGFQLEADQEKVSTDDMIQSLSIFGGVKKVVTSKNFKGGEIFCFMGGAEINLSQADINGTVILEITQAFGGTKLVVPPHWDVRQEAIAIFAGIEDKRPHQMGNFDPNKVLIIKGTTVFGGIEIKSY